MNGHDKVLDILIKSGADPSITDLEGALPLDYADFRGYDSLAQYLLPKSVPKNITPESLFELIDDNNVKAIAFCLSAGIDPNYFDGSEYPLHHALRTGHLEAAIALINGGADVTKKSKGSNPLHIAASKGYTPLCKLLVRSGCDINEKNSQNGNTALLFAMRNGKYDTAAALLQLKADPLIPNSLGNTPLMEAIIDRNHNYMPLMIQSGALKRVNREVLLAMCLQAGRTELAFTLSVAKGDFAEFDFLNEKASALQVKILAQNSGPLKTLDLIRSHSLLGHTNTTFSLIDSL